MIGGVIFIACEGDELLGDAYTYGPDEPVKCDLVTNDVEIEGTADEALAYAREQAARDGWTVRGGHDLCPACTAKLNALCPECMARGGRGPAAKATLE